MDGGSAAFARQQHPDREVLYGAASVLLRLGSLSQGEARACRYAWFTARATNVGTAPSLLVDGKSTLTTVGGYYNREGDSLPDDSSSASSLRSVFSKIASTKPTIAWLLW